MGDRKNINRYTVLLILLISMASGCSSSSNSAHIDTQGVTSLDFGLVHLNDTKEMSFDVYSTAKKPLHIERIEMQTGTDYAIVKVLDNTGVYVHTPYSCELDKNEKITVFIAFSPTAMGKLFDSVLISHDASNEPNPLPVSCEGEGDTPLEPEINIVPPTQIDFGTVKIRMNLSVEKTVEIENNGNYELEISELKLENDSDFRISEVKDFSGSTLFSPYNTNVKVGEKMTVKIKFEPMDLKIFNDKLIIKHNAPNEATPYIVNLTGEGVAPTISIKDTKLLDSDGSDRATGYAMGSRVITAGGKIFTAWADNSRGSKMRSYDVATSTWGNNETVGTYSQNSSGPAITMDSKGYIYIIYGPNNGQYVSTRSVSPYDISAWQRTTSFGTDVQYVSLVCDNNDKVHCSYLSKTTIPKIIYQTYVGGGSWSHPVELINFGSSSSSYWYFGSLAISPNGDLNYAFYVYGYGGISGGKYVGYIRSKDGGTTWENADGMTLSLPITSSSNCFVEQGGNLDMRIGNMSVDDKGNPWIAITHLESTPTVKLAHHDGNTWQLIDLLPELQKNIPNMYLSMATLSFDTEGMLYATATTLAPGYSTWYGDNSHEVVLFASADYGKTFQFLQISQSDPNNANWLPSIERPYSTNGIGVPSLIYTHGKKSSPPTEVIFTSLQKQ